MLGYHHRAVGIVDCPELDKLIIINVMIDFSLAHTECGHGLSTIDTLSCIVNHIPFHQRHDIIAQRFGMHTNRIRKVPAGSKRFK
jgi:hypothetical protein